MNRLLFIAYKQTTSGKLLKSTCQAILSGVFLWVFLQKNQMAKITIPEYEQVGMSPINVLNSTICILDYSIERLSLKYKLNTINPLAELIH